jgi:hypothetical protein
MRYSSAFAIGCAAILLFFSVARAQIETTPIPTTPKPDFSSMSFLAGTWNCTERNTRRPSAYTYTNTNSMDPSGYWMVTNAVSHPSSWAPTETKSVIKTTYDGSTSRWVAVSTDDQGGYDLSTSSGWKGDKIVWHDESYPKTNNTATSGDTTVTKASATKTTYTSSFTEPSGRTVNITGSCTKS